VARPLPEVSAGLSPDHSGGTSRGFSGNSLGAFAAFTVPVLPLRFIATSFFKAEGGGAAKDVDRQAAGLLI